MCVSAKAGSFVERMTFGEQGTDSVVTFCRTIFDEISLNAISVIDDGSIQVAEWEIAARVSILGAILGKRAPLKCKQIFEAFIGERNSADAIPQGQIQTTSQV